MKRELIIIFVLMLFISITEVHTVGAWPILPPAERFDNPTSEPDETQFDFFSPLPEKGNGGIILRLQGQIDVDLYGGCNNNTANEPTWDYDYGNGDAPRIFQWRTVYRGVTQTGAANGSTSFSFNNDTGKNQYADIYISNSGYACSDISILKGASGSPLTRWNNGGSGWCTRRVVVKPDPSWTDILTL